MTSEERAWLEHRIAELEEVNHGLRHELLRSASEHGRVASVLAACHRLHATLERGTMLIALHDALVGLLGCDEVAVLERGPDGTLGVAACFGLCEATVMPMPEAVLASALAGRRFVGLHDPAAVSRRPMVCVPLRVDERVLGALAVYRLSDRKGGLGDRDWALLDLLAVHIATALVATRPASGPR